MGYFATLLLFRLLLSKRKNGKSGVLQTAVLLFAFLMFRWYVPSSFVAELSSCCGNFCTVVGASAVHVHPVKEVFHSSCSRHAFSPCGRCLWCVDTGFVCLDCVTGSLERVACCCQAFFLWVVASLSNIFVRFCLCASTAVVSSQKPRQVPQRVRLFCDLQPGGVPMGQEGVLGVPREGRGRVEGEEQLFRNRSWSCRRPINAQGTRCPELANHCTFEIEGQR